MFGCGEQEADVGGDGDDIGEHVEDGCCKKLLKFGMGVCESSGEGAHAHQTENNLAVYVRKNVVGLCQFVSEGRDDAAYRDEQKKH